MEDIHWQDGLLKASTTDCLIFAYSLVGTPQLGGYSWARWLVCFRRERCVLVLQRNVNRLPVSAWVEVKFGLPDAADKV